VHPVGKNYALDQKIDGTFFDDLDQLYHHTVVVWCSGNALVLINAVALHRARLLLGWVTAFG